MKTTASEQQQQLRHLEELHQAMRVAQKNLKSAMDDAKSKDFRVPEEMKRQYDFAIDANRELSLGKSKLRERLRGYETAKKAVDEKLFLADEYGSNWYSESRVVHLTSLKSDSDIAQAAKEIIGHYLPGFAMSGTEIDGLCMALHESAIKLVSRAATESSSNHFWLSQTAATVREEIRILEAYNEGIFAREKWERPEADVNVPEMDEVRGLLAMFEAPQTKKAAEAGKGNKHKGKRVYISWEQHEADGERIKKLEEQQTEAGRQANLLWATNFANENNHRRAYTTLLSMKGEDPTPQEIAYLVDSSSPQAVGLRIRRWRKRIGLDIKDVAEKLRVKVQAISNWENGHAMPSDTNLRLLARIFGIKSRYLEFGIEDDDAERLATGEREARNVRHEFLEVPLFNDIKVAAGSGDISFVGDEGDTKPLAFRSEFFASRNIDRRKAKCLKVGGNSMSPYLQDGDVVLIEYDSEVRVKDGHCYALRYGTELRIKRLKMRLDGGLDLISDNKDYQIETVKPDEMQYVTVLGEVRWRAG